MKEKLSIAKSKGSKIVYIDETMFTRSTVPKKEYCYSKKNMTVD